MRHHHLGSAALFGVLAILVGGCPTARPRIGSGDLPRTPEALLDDLRANDLELFGWHEVNATVRRLDLRRGPRRFRAKWKPLGPRGSEVQEGFDGNNAPRCEVAAWRLSRWLFGPQSNERQIVPPVVVRAFHRPVPCDRACAKVPRLAALAAEPTFPGLNDHLVLGAISFWVEGVRHPARFRGDLWDAERFGRDRRYRRSFSDLAVLLVLIAHGDANYADNFLMTRAGRIYSIDNGRALDGVPYYTDEADPDWRPFAQLSPERIFAPSFSRTTVARLSTLDRQTLERELRVVAAVEMNSGRSIADPSMFAVLLPHLERHGRGVYAGRVEGEPWVLLGIGEAGIAAVGERARALVRRLGVGGVRLFDD